MALITSPTLKVETCGDDIGRRRLLVEYDVTFEPDEATVGSEVLARVVVNAVDRHDAAVLPSTQPIAGDEDAFHAVRGTVHRTHEYVVHRSDLDVEQDLWRADNGGTPQPIAEWLDHLAAMVTLDVAGSRLAEAATPVVTGSWGVLGSD